VRPFIFIVYSDYEHALAKALKGLLESWGFDAFYCRQEIRVLATSKSYRQDLAENLVKADLVILVLSNAFRQSQYCQAEAGATVTLDKPHIQIMIPPVSYQTIKEVSPVLEGRQIIDGGQPLTVVDDLRAQLASTPKFSEQRLPRTTDPHAEKTWTDTFDAALAVAVQRYRIEPPSRASIGFWDTLTEASRSIIDNIREAVATGPTHVAVVGVSLKYSIHILTTAIEEAAADTKASGQAAGPLTIELVHVDDQSHILHSLKDNIDIGNVLDYLRIGWPQWKAGWEDICGKAGIEIDVKAPVAIDYIPQQVGIRIRGLPGDSSVLYAGSCSFDRKGQQVSLLVGEREYFYYSSRSADVRATKAIAVFNQYLAQYRSPQNSGATLVIDHQQWITRLEECVLSYPDLKQLVLVSNTSQKFFQLIIPALQRHLTVKVYTSHPDLLSAREGALVEALEERLDQEIATRLPAGWSGAVELTYCRTLPTFRAALIGDAVLGMQAYTINGNPRPASAGRQDDPQPRTTASFINTELRLIVTRYGEHFQKLRENIDRQCGWADPEPYCVRRGA
jgi:TIR domain